MDFQEEKLHQISKALSNEEKRIVAYHIPDSILKEEQDRRYFETCSKVFEIFKLVEDFQNTEMTYENGKDFLREISEVLRKRITPERNETNER